MSPAATSTATAVPRPTTPATLDPVRSAGAGSTVVCAMPPGYAGHAGARRAPGRRLDACWHTAPGDGDALERSCARPPTGAAGGRCPGWPAPMLEAARVLDVCCGSGRDRRRAGARSVGGRGPPAVAPGRTGRVRAERDRVPDPDQRRRRGRLLLTLPRLTDLDGVFAELRRVLRPGGTLVVVVPSVTVRSVRSSGSARRCGRVRRGTGATGRRSTAPAGCWPRPTSRCSATTGCPSSLPLPDADSVPRARRRSPAAGLWPPTSRPRCATGH